MTKKEPRPQGRDQSGSVPGSVSRGDKTPAAPGPGTGSPASQDTDLEDATGNVLVLEVEGLRYELDHGPSRKSGKKVVATVQLAGSTAGPPFVDRLDLYSFRSRVAFSTLVAESFGKTRDQVLGHLAVLLDQIERAQERPKTVETVLLSPERRVAAEALLGSADLLTKAAEAIDALGYVGEPENKRLAYLVATSRLLLRPLSAILRAPSGAGKSELLEKTAQLMPEESVEYLSRLTPASLYYLGPDHLRHKLVLVDEQAGATDADYPIRTLQSRGLLRLVTVVKGKTEPFTVNGPIALMSATTDSNLNPENLSRCLELTLDDSPKQTKRIQEAQRQAWAGAGRPQIDTQLWKDAQRVLEPFEVAIPFAPELTFPTRTTKDRRDNMKLLSLIATHALLHQRQRERDERGRLLATARDYEAAFRLVFPLVEAELEDLSPRASAVYRELARRKHPVTRREIANQLGWPYTTTRRALDELVAHELASSAEDEEGLRRYSLLDTVTVGAGSELREPSAIGGSLEVAKSGKARQARGKAPGKQSQRHKGQQEKD